MDLRDENLDRLRRVHLNGIPTSAMADTINAAHGTTFTGDGMRQILEFDKLGKRKMLLSQTQEQAFDELMEEIRGPEEVAAVGEKDDGH